MTLWIYKPEEKGGDINQSVCYREIKVDRCVLHDLENKKIRVKARERTNCIKPGGEMVRVAFME